MQTIHQILDKADSLISKEVVVHGWVRAYRSGGSGKLHFIKVYDGSTIKDIQCVFEGTMDKLDYQSSVIITGTLVTSPAKGQTHEVKATSVKLLCGCDPTTFPLPQTELELQTLRHHPDLRMRLPTSQAIMRIRHRITQTIHNFFDEQDFTLVQTPLITQSDCEGAGEAFSVVTSADKDFFGEGVKAYLTVSGQLQGEAAARGLGRIYTFGTTFRAEKSKTSRHLAEFLMIEPEMAFYDMDMTIDLAIRMVKACIQACLVKCMDEIVVLEKKCPGLVKKLEDTVAKDFMIITYTEAIEILQKSGATFEVAPVWGIDMSSEHERFLTENIFDRCTVVKCYPKDIKAFYMHENDDGKTVASFDLLIPGVGELIGGSQREVRYDVLKAKMDAKGLDYKWYQDLRRYGNVPTSGYGLGFDRLVRYITGIEHIRDVVPFPVAYQSLAM